MKTLSFTQIAVINSKTAEEFQEQFNSKMQELSDNNPSYEFNHDMGFCAYITYTKEKEVYDSISDKFREKGLKYKCYQCPHSVLVSDKRVKKLICEKSPAGFARKYDSVCDIFYNELDAGLISPREVVM